MPALRAKRATCKLTPNIDYDHSCENINRKCDIKGNSVNFLPRLKFLTYKKETDWSEE